MHVDLETVYTMSVALSNYDSYEGGYFRLATKEALFKVPRRSAVVFFGESAHGITDISKGERKVYAVELWEDDDVPTGVPRPGLADFKDYKEQRQAVSLEYTRDNGCDNEW